MTRLKVRDHASEKGFNMSQLLAAVNQRLNRDSPIAMGTIRRYWYSTKDGKESGSPIELVDILLLNAIAKVLDVELIDLINTGELEQYM